MTPEDAERDAWIQSAQTLRAAHDRLAAQLARAGRIIQSLVTHAPPSSMAVREARAFLGEIG